MKSGSLFVAVLIFLGSLLYLRLPAQVPGGAAVYTQREVRSGGATYAYIDSAVKSILAFRQAFPDSAIAQLRALYPICDLLGYNEGKAGILIWTGSIMMKEKADPREALRYFRKAYPYCLTAKKNREGIMVIWCSDMGGAFTHLNMADSAMFYYSWGLNMALKYNWTDRIELGRIYHNMAALHFNMGQHDKALLYTQKALAIALKLNSSSDIAENYLNMISVLGAQNNFGLAVAYMKKIDSLNIPPGDPIHKFEYDIYGNMYLKQGMPRNAIFYYEKELAAAGSEARYRISAFIGMGCAYAQLKDLRKADRYFREALSVFVNGDLEARDVNLRLNLYDNLAETSDSLGNFKDAYYFKSLSAALHDSLNNAERFRNMNELEVRYRTSEKDRDLTRQQLQLAGAANSLNTKNIWIGGTMAGILILGLFIIQLLQRTRAKEQKQKLEHMKMLITGEENERKRIGQQLHDDVMVEFSIVRMNMGTLPVQYPELSEIKEYDEILHQLNQASFKLRQTAHNLMPDALLEEGLVSAIGYFCRGIQQMTPLVIDFQHYGDMPRLAPATEIAIYRIVQELIQNVIKHAAATDVLVQLNYRKGHLSLTVEDNGIGLDPAGVRVTNGIGLSSIRTRLKAINGQMEIHACTPQGTSINMEINLSV